MKPAAPVTTNLTPLTAFRFRPAEPGSAEGSRQTRGTSFRGRERLQRPVAVLREAEIGEEARHHDPLAEVAETRLGPLAARQRERELGVLAPGSEGQRKTAAEARIDVGDEVRAVVLAEALDVRGPDQPQLLRDVARERDQGLVSDRHALDRLAPLRLDHRARNRVQAPAVEVGEA